MTAQPISFAANDHKTLRLDLEVRDAEVVAELQRRAEGLERTTLALHALRIGVLALRQASGGIDIDSVRRAGDEVVGSVREVLVEHAARTNENMNRVVAEYFDPKSGSLPQRLDQLTKGDGDLERAIMRHFDGDRSTLHRTLDGLVGPQSSLQKLLSPEQAGGVVLSVKSAVDALLEKQRKEVLGQFSLDTKGSALSRLVEEVTTTNGKLRSDLAADLDKVAREFSLDNNDGALSRLVGRVEKAQKTIVEQLSLDHSGSALQRMSQMMESTGKTIERSLTLDVETSPLARLKRELVEITRGIEQSQTSFQAEIREAVATLQTRKREAERSTVHGATFEDAMEPFLDREASRCGDLYERTGARPTASGAKKGDHVITLGPDTAAPGARIVIESKAKKSCTVPTALIELAAARENRAAQIGIFVFKRASAPDGLEGLRRVGSDILAIWDDEDPTTDIYLTAALSVARALAVRERASHEQDETSLREIERAVKEIEKQAKSIDEIIRAGRTVEQKGATIQSLAGPMKAALEAQLGILRQSVDTLRGDADTTSAS